MSAAIDPSAAAIGQPTTDVVYRQLMWTVLGCTGQKSLWHTRCCTQTYPTQFFPRFPPSLPPPFPPFPPFPPHFAAVCPPFPSPSSCFCLPPPPPRFPRSPLFFPVFHRFPPFSTVFPIFPRFPVVPVVYDIMGGILDLDTSQPYVDQPSVAVNPFSTAADQHQEPRVTIACCCSVVTRPRSFTKHGPPLEAHPMHKGCC